MRLPVVTVRAVGAVLSLLVRSADGWVNGANPPFPFAMSGVNVLACDDCTQQRTPPQPFPFAGSTYSPFWVSSNGFINFSGTSNHCCSVHATSDILLAVYWEDVDCGNSNQWPHRAFSQQYTRAQNGPLFDLFEAEVHQFDATFDTQWLFQVTYNNCEQYSSGYRINAQIVMGTDWASSWIVYVYGQINYKSGNPAMAGVNGANNERFHIHPNSPGDLSILSTTSNYGKPAYWIFDFSVDPGEIGATPDPLGPCLSNPCAGNGVCWAPTPESFACNCLSGYAGTTCQGDLNECDSDPCIHGSCTLPNFDMYECVCDAGWFGVNCEADINECASAPCVNGVCWAPELSVWKCECFDGYEGITCANDIVECASNPCIHGQCSELKIAEFNCSCDAGYTGVQCDIDIDECASEPCGQQGVCTQPDIDSFQCDCLPGWTGQLCTEEIDECASSPCVNGTCVDGDNGFTCNCFPGYDGTLCNIDPRVNFDRCEHWPQDPEVPGCDKYGYCVEGGTVLTTRNCLKQCTCTLNKKGTKAKFKCKKLNKKSQAMKEECQVCLNTPVDCTLKFIEGFVKCLERLDGSPMDEYNWERNMKNKDDAIVRDICFATIQ